jgi:hypothetical protein
MTPARLAAVLVGLGFGAVVGFRSWPVALAFLGILAFAATILYLELGVSKFEGELKTLREDAISTRARMAELERIVTDKDAGALEQIRRIRLRMGMESK